MASFVIVMGAAPHMRLLESGREFAVAGRPMTFDDHDAAFAYVLAHTETPPLQGLRAEIIEDLEA